MLTTTQLVEQTHCLDNVSKDLEGELIPVDHDPRRCEETSCETLVTQHVLVVELVSHDCDSEPGRILDGRLVVKDLAHVYATGDGRERGVHAGTFTWRSSVGILQGRLVGITNAGTHRDPPFDACQRCHEPGVMEGQLWGAFRRVREPRFRDCVVQAAYRIRFDPSDIGGQGAVRGTLEGGLLCACSSRECVDLGQLPTNVTQPNPLVVGGATFLVFDHNGAQLPSSIVLTYFDQGGSPFTGLHTERLTEITLPRAADTVELTLFSGAHPAKLDAVDSAGAIVGSASMASTHAAEIVTLSGGGPFTAVRVTAPGSEVLIQRLCLV